MAPLRGPGIGPSPPSCSVTDWIPGRFLELAMASSRPPRPGVTPQTAPAYFRGSTNTPGQVWRGVCGALTAPGYWSLPSLLLCNRLDSRAVLLPLQCLQYLLVGRAAVFQTDYFQLPRTRSARTIPTPYHWCLGLYTVGFVTMPTFFKIFLWPSSFPARTC